MLLTVAPVITSVVSPGPNTALPLLSTRIRSGLPSNRSTQHGEPAGNGAGSSTPRAWNGRLIVGRTPKYTPLVDPVAAASLTLPCVGATTFSVFTCTRMASYFSSWPSPSAGFVSAVVSVTGVGNALPVESTTTVGLMSSVTDRKSGSNDAPLGANS